MKMKQNVQKIIDKEDLKRYNKYVFFDEFLNT